MKSAFLPSVTKQSPWCSSGYASLMVFALRYPKVSAKSSEYCPPFKPKLIADYALLFYFSKGASDSNLRAHDYKVETATHLWV